MNAADKKALRTLKSYCERYAVNRPFLAPETPDLIVAVLSGTGREVYNRSGGGVIAVFSSTDAARKACHTVTGRWP